VRAAEDLAGWLGTSARIEPAQIAAGERGAIVVTLTIPHGCHIQSHDPAEPFLIPTTLRLDAPEGLALGPVEYPGGEKESFDWSPVVIDVYRGATEVVVLVEVEAGARPGRRTISGRIRYQGCTATACLPPTEREVEVDVEVI